MSVHETPVELLKLQAECLGIPFLSVKIPDSPTNEVWENRWLEAIAPFEAQGVAQVAYGDLFLKDIRAYREKMHERSALEPVFPIWKLDTQKMPLDFIEAGFEALIASVDLKKLPAERVGSSYNLDFLKSLPPSADPCGENGEFHTFVHHGPIFKKPVSFDKGKTRIKTFGGAHAFEIAYAELSLRIP